MDTFSRIDWQLKRKNVSWKKLMDNLELSPSTLWRWRNNESRPRRQTLRKIEKILGLKTGCLEGIHPADPNDLFYVSPDGWVLCGKAKQALEQMLTSRSLSDQHDALKALRSYFARIFPRKENTGANGRGKNRIETEEELAR